MIPLSSFGKGHRRLSVPGLVTMGVIDPLETVPNRLRGRQKLSLIEQQPIQIRSSRRSAGCKGQSSFVEVRLLAHLVIILAHLRQLGMEIA